MIAKAHATYVRISPRRVDQILMMVRGKSVATAMSLLRLVTKGARPLVEKTLTSAFANAGKNQNPSGWYVQQAWVGGGPQLKRMRAHAMGRGATIRHRTTHLTIILSDQKTPARKRRTTVTLGSKVEAN
jgi:large subunit ribosomal protein L22